MTLGDVARAFNSTRETRTVTVAFEHIIGFRCHVR